MNSRHFVLGLCLAVLPLSAFAHKEGHGDENKPLATTCAQLADPRHYVVDPAYPEIKALKTKCDAEKKASPKPKPDPEPAKKS